jgi:periplasmic protein TonB
VSILFENTIPMSATDTTLPGRPPGPPVEPGPEKGVVASGWLGSQSIFDRPDERKLGRAMATSLIVHAGIIGIAFYILMQHPQVVAQTVPMVYNVFFKQEPGPGGGGGGSPAPAPKKQLEIPKTKAPDPVPVVMPPPPVQPPPPTPELNAPIMTNSAVLQTSGVSTISNAQYGGGGRGTGMGPGTGNGVGPGTGGGFGGGAFRAGAGINFPTPIRSEQPKYTSEAMRAKIQGTAEVEAVVLPNGTVGDVRIMKSLDKQYGLDQEALAAAKKWLFRPGTDKNGQPIPVIVTIILEFRLH